jgi:ATP synthase protein I
MSDDSNRRAEADFDARLKQARDAARPVADDKGALKAPNSGLGVAFRIGVELVSALAVGVGIGYLIDMWLETRPWGMVVFFFIGAAAGILNVYRAAGSIGLSDEKKD